MERRTFMNNAAGAATALAFKPMALAGEHDKIPVSIPIRWWKWVSLGRKIQSRQRGGRAVIYRNTVGRRAVCFAGWAVSPVQRHSPQPDAAVARRHRRGQRFP
jgi:hypothetical protein